MELPQVLFPYLPYGTILKWRRVCRDWDLLGGEALKQRVGVWVRLHPLGDNWPAWPRFLSERGVPIAPEAEPSVIIDTLWQALRADQRSHMKSSVQECTGTKGQKSSYVFNAQAHPFFGWWPEKSPKVWDLVFAPNVWKALSYHKEWVLVLEWAVEPFLNRLDCNNNTVLDVFNENRIHIEIRHENRVTTISEVLRQRGAKTSAELIEDKIKRLQPVPWQIMVTKKLWRLLPLMSDRCLRRRTSDGQTIIDVALHSMPRELFQHLCKRGIRCNPRILLSFWKELSYATEDDPYNDDLFWRPDYPEWFKIEDLLFLKRAGALADIKDKQGNIPAFMAIQAGSVEFAIELCSSQQLYAYTSEHKDMFTLLLSHPKLTINQFRKLISRKNVKPWNLSQFWIQHERWSPYSERMEYDVEVRWTEIPIKEQVQEGILAGGQWDLVSILHSWKLFLETINSTNAKKIWNFAPAIFKECSQDQQRDLIAKLIEFFTDKEMQELSLSGKPELIENMKCALSLVDENCDTILHRMARTGNFVLLADTQLLKKFGFHDFSKKNKAGEMIGDVMWTGGQMRKSDITEFFQRAKLQQVHFLQHYFWSSKTVLYAYNQYDWIQAFSPHDFYYLVDHCSFETDWSVQDSDGQTLIHRFLLHFLKHDMKWLFYNDKQTSEDVWWKVTKAWADNYRQQNRSSEDKLSLFEMTNGDGLTVLDIIFRSTSFGERLFRRIVGDGPFRSSYNLYGQAKVETLWHHASLAYLCRFEWFLKACKNTNRDVNTLIAHGAKLEATDEHGNTAAHNAAAKGHYDAITLFVNPKLKLPLNNNEEGVLDCAMKTMKKRDITAEKIKQLIQHGANCSPRTLLNILNQSPLLLDSALLKLLLSKGASKSVTDSDGNPPAFLLAKAGRYESASLSLDEHHKTSVNDSGATFLDVCIQSKCIKASQYCELLQSGFKCGAASILDCLNAFDKMKDDDLVSLFALLKQNGALLTATDTTGNTAAHRVAKMDHSVDAIISLTNSESGVMLNQDKETGMDIYVRLNPGLLFEDFSRLQTAGARCSIATATFYAVRNGFLRSPLQFESKSQDELEAIMSSVLDENSVRVL